MSDAVGVRSTAVGWEELRVVFRLRGLLLALLASVFGLNLNRAEDPSGLKSTGPVRVFLLIGQSNMEGQSVADLDGPDYNGGRGTLRTVLASGGEVARFRHWLAPEGGWRVRDDVRVWYRTEDGTVKTGPLGLGYTPYGDRHHFGPELEFGWVVGEASPSPVLLIKTAWGGKSLFADFRPPGAGGTVGPYYLRVLDDVRAALEDLRRDDPVARTNGFELSGLVWYQGWNDGCDPARAIPEYRRNLVQFIRDIRRDLVAPGLPVVVGELTGPWVDAPEEWERLRESQRLAAGDPGIGPRVAFVSTRAFVRRADDSPNPGHGHHEFGNAETGLLVGEALGKAMVGLVGSPAVPGYSRREVRGWTLFVDRRLAARSPVEVETALGILDQQLEEICRVVPSWTLPLLRRVPLWFSSEYPGVRPGAEYHPDAGWLRANRRNPDMARGIEFTDIPIFPQEASRMPNFVLHELAHAFHDQVLGFEHPGVEQAYRAAVASRAYDRVARRLGSGRPETQERVYAMVDAKEYFAEGTEAFFSRNDFFPFDRADLRRTDPSLEKLLGELWSRPQSSRNTDP